MIIKFLKKKFRSIRFDSFSFPCIFLQDVYKNINIFEESFLDKLKRTQKFIRKISTYFLNYKQFNIYNLYIYILII